MLGSLSGVVINDVCFECGWGLLWTNLDIFNDKVSEKTKIYLLKGGFLQLAI